MPETDNFFAETHASIPWRVEDIGPAAIPARAAKYFLYKSFQNTINPVENLSGYSNLFLVKDTTSTYVATETKTYSKTNGETERLIYLHDHDDNGTFLGRGEIRLNISDDSDSSKDKPFVGYTYTEVAFLRQGLGARRLQVMNMLTERMYGLKLHSDISLSQDAKRVWRKLVREGTAVHYKEGERDRFRFL